jgi:hypothetical protein
MQPELVIASTLHLMSHYTIISENAQACTRLAAVIQRHLKCLAAMQELSPVLQGTCQKLSEQWEQFVDHAVPESQKTGFLRRVMLGVQTR